MSLDMITVNNAGNARDNPIVAGLAFRLRLAKHGASDVLRRCWVSVGGVFEGDLTGLCSETDEEVAVDVVAGVHLTPGTPPTLNVVHFTTTEGKHAKAGVWVADLPEHKIELDGYDAEDPAKPLIVPWYVSG